LVIFLTSKKDGLQIKREGLADFLILDTYQLLFIVKYFLLS